MDTENPNHCNNKKKKSVTFVECPLPYHRSYRWGQRMSEPRLILHAYRKYSPGANVVDLSPVGILGCKQATHLNVLRGP